MSLVEFGNKYYDDNKPWVLFKENKEEFDKVMYNCETIIANLANLFEPIMPETANKIAKYVNVKLDNYGSDYLEKKDEDFTLDYTSDFGVNSDNYRITYMANKYSNFNLYFDENNVLILECTQYILYSNINFLERNQGDIKVNFKLKDDKTAFEFLNVKVEK